MHKKSQLSGTCSPPFRESLHWELEVAKKWCLASEACGFCPEQKGLR